MIKANVLRIKKNTTFQSIASKILHFITPILLNEILNLIIIIVSAYYIKLIIGFMK